MDPSPPREISGGYELAVNPTSIRAPSPALSTTSTSSSLFIRQIDVGTDAESVAREKLLRCRVCFKPPEKDSPPFLACFTCRARHIHVQCAPQAPSTQDQEPWQCHPCRIRKKPASPVLSPAGGEHGPGLSLLSHDDHPMAPNPRRKSKLRETSLRQVMLNIDADVDDIDVDTSPLETGVEEIEHIDARTRKERTDSPLFVGSQSTVQSDGDRMPVAPDSNHEADTVVQRSSHQSSAKLLALPQLDGTGVANFNSTDDSSAAANYAPQPKSFGRAPFAPMGQPNLHTSHKGPWAVPQSRAPQDHTPTSSDTSGILLQSGPAMKFASSPLGATFAFGPPATKPLVGGATGNDGHFAGKEPTARPPGQPTVSTGGFEILTSQEKEIARRLRSQHDAELVRFRKTEELHARRIKDLEADVARLGRENKTLQTTGDKNRLRLVSEVEQSKRNVRSLQDQLNEEKLKSGDKVHTADDLERAVAEKQREFEAADRGAARWETRVNDLSRMNEELQSSLAEARKESEPQIQRHQRQVEKLKKEIDKLKEKDADRERLGEDAQKMLENSLEDYKGRLEDQKKKLESRTRELNEVQSAAKVFVDKNEALESLNQNLTTRVERLERKIRDTEKTSAQLQRAKERVEHLEEARDERLSALETLKEEHAILNEELKKERESSKTSKQILELERDNALRKVEQLQQSLEEVYERLNRWKALAKELEGEKAQKNAWQRRARKMQERLTQTNEKLYRIAQVVQTADKSANAAVGGELARIQRASNVSRKVMPSQTKLPTSEAQRPLDVRRTSLDAAQTSALATPPVSSSRDTPASAPKERDDFIKIEVVEALPDGRSRPGSAMPVGPASQSPRQERLPETSRRYESRKRRRVSISPSDADILTRPPEIGKSGHGSENSGDDDNDSDGDGQEDGSSIITRKITRSSTNQAAKNPMDLRRLLQSKRSEGPKGLNIAKKSAPSSRGGLLGEQDTIVVARSGTPSGSETSSGESSGLSVVVATRTSLRKTAAMNSFNSVLGVPKKSRPISVGGRLAFVSEDEDADGENTPGPSRKSKRKAAGRTLPVGRDVHGYLQ